MVTTNGIKGGIGVRDVVAERRRKMININKLHIVLSKASNRWCNNHGEMEDGYMRSLAEAVFKYIEKNIPMTKYSMRRRGYEISKEERE